MPTLRQQFAAQKVSEIIRSGKKVTGITMQKVLLEAGYSQSVAKKPQLVLRRKGYQELMTPQTEQDISLYESMAENLQLLLHAVKVKQYTFPAELSDEEIKDILESMPDHKCIVIQHRKKTKVAQYSAPDHRIRAKTLDILCKVEGLYEQAKVEARHRLKDHTSPIETMSTDELYKELDRITLEISPNTERCNECHQLKQRG